MNEYKDFINCNYPRLDRYVSEHLSLLTRSQLKQVPIPYLAVDGKKAKWSQKVTIGQLLEMTWQPIAPTSLIAQDIPLDIIYEDEHVWVINKPQGMVVHPGAGRQKDTLANALAHQLLKGNASVYDSQRPGIVHRLDMETSGVIICAKDPDTHQFLSEQFKNRLVKKRYMAILDTPSITPARGLIRNYIDRSRRVRTHFVCGDDPERGRLAVTGYRLLRTFGRYSLVLFKPHTGRTHQLRVHAKNELAPILGDPIYHPHDKSHHRLMLHAWKLQITLPNEEEPRIFTAPVPNRFYEALSIRKKDPDPDRS